MNILERQLKGLDDMETWTTTVQSNSGKILREILKIRDIADEQLQQLRACSCAMLRGGALQIMEWSVAFQC